MSKTEKEVLRSIREDNSKSKYEILNNNELKFKKQNPSPLKEREFENKEE